MASAARVVSWSIVGAVNVQACALCYFTDRWCDLANPAKLALSLAQSITYGLPELSLGSRSFGSANASPQCNKRPQTQSNDLHSILQSTFPEVPFRSMERQLASPFLTILPILTS
jgi:hypothetical protein